MARSPPETPFAVPEAGGVICGDFPDGVRDLFSVIAGRRDHGDVSPFASAEGIEGVYGGD